ncbi:MAG TPA: hypothetical protein VFE05_11695, partial [Longimicrobiaceae bacterium]|nr:hypothetical protein [Longimicrobiaceae bacterium]
LALLERDGLARQAGVRRLGDARKPSVLYELPGDAEPLLSRAYPPVLTALVASVVDTLPRRRANAMLRDVGRRLARGTGGEATGTLEQRVSAAAAILTSLGGDVEVTQDEGALYIRGSGCPLSATVSHHPALCRTVEALLTEVVGAPTRQACEHGTRPRCRFVIETVDSAA